jgi:cephalosporin hydroxylase
MFKFTLAEERVKFNYKTIDAGHDKVTYRGIKTQRSPFDYVLYQMILFEIQPDLIIEIGTRYGGGALYLADLLDIRGGGVIHSIDITNECQDIVKKHPRIKLFHNGWENYDINLTSTYNKILVIDDGSHYYEQTLDAMRKFSSIVTPASYLIVEDGIIDKLGISKDYNGGPCRAIREFLRSNENFVVERRWCDFFGKNATNNVNGYLKRIS